MHTHTHTHTHTLQYRMVVKATLDLLIVFVNYSEQVESGSGTPVRAGVDSPSRLESPDSLPTNALLFKDAVEIVSEDKGEPFSLCLSVCLFDLSVRSVCLSVCLSV